MSDYHNGVTNDLVGYWTKRDGELQYRNWMSTSLTSTFNIATFAEDKSEAFEAIHKNFVRGFRTTKAFESLEDAFIKHFVTSSNEWAMSYLGKAEMKIRLPRELLRKLKDEVVAVTELMQSRTHMEDWNGFLHIKAGVSNQKMETRTGKMKNVPIIDHQFQQVRPLVIKALADAYPLRETVVEEWRRKPKFTMYL
jgi:hypothetical protein